MKITFVMPGEGGISGGNRVIAIHAAGLAARGHDVTVLWHRFPKPVGRMSRLRARLRDTLRGGRETDGRDRRYFDAAGVRQISPARPGWTLRAGDVPDADAVIATWWETAFEVADLPPSKGAPFYFVQHHEVHDFIPRHLSRGSYYLPLRKITISRWLVDLMAEEYGDRDVALVENSVDTGLFHAPPRERNAVPTVGLLYARQTFKGVDVSLAAIAAARRSVPDLRVKAFGKTAPDPELPLPEGAEFVLNPAQETIRDIYAGCDVWLCGSRAEGFHLPPLEAMACRTPVVSTRVGGPMDTIEDGVNGFVVDVEDAEALAAKLVEVARMPPEAWRAMSDAALAQARAYSWDDATDLFEAALTGGQSLRRHGRAVGAD